MTHINQRRDYANVWRTFNPVLQDGEVGWERDTLLSKLGDGSTPWNDLPYTRSSLAATKADLGLDQVDNTRDADKPISVATQAALDGLSASKASKFGTELLAQDLNSLKSTGFYHGTELSNGPVAAAAGFLRVTGDGSTYAEQTFRVESPAAGSSGFYQRVYLGGAWSTWVEMARVDSPKFTGLPTTPTSAVANYKTTLVANTLTVNNMLRKNDMPLCYLQSISQNFSLAANTETSVQFSTVLKTNGDIGTEGVDANHIRSIVINDPGWYDFRAGFQTSAVAARRTYATFGFGTAAGQPADATAAYEVNRDAIFDITTSAAGAIGGSIAYTRFCSPGDRISLRMLSTVACTVGPFTYLQVRRVHDA